jgi:hypothetical protein
MCRRLRLRRRVAHSAGGRAAVGLVAPDVSQAKRARGKARYEGTATTAPKLLMTVAMRGPPRARARGPRKKAHVAEMRPAARSVGQIPFEPRRAQMAERARSCTAPAVPPACTTLQRVKRSGRSRYRCCTNPSRAEMVSKMVPQTRSDLSDSILSGCHAVADHSCQQSVTISSVPCLAGFRPAGATERQRAQPKGDRIRTCPG